MGTLNGILIEANEANFEFHHSSRDMGQKSEIQDPDMPPQKLQNLLKSRLLGQNLKFASVAPLILVLYATTHASSYSSFFWRVPGLKKSAFTSSIPSISERIIEAQIRYTGLL